MIYEDTHDLVIKWKKMSDEYYIQAGKTVVPFPNAVSTAASICEARLYAMKAHTLVWCANNLSVAMRIDEADDNE